MPFLDIEKAIKGSEIGSRFRLVHIAGQRARELNAPSEGTIPPVVTEFSKITTNALQEVIERKIVFLDKNAETATEI
ncbi:MAG: DNA-directed RNA polymerase subunit omega [Deferribacteraceae bacterium]|jgi:DNA-directed RNA polymerase subunit omega|nr:DNA-directed RNA polymerase subunit omega [Deferribacteraceae bacterium]